MTGEHQETLNRTNGPVKACERLLYMTEAVSTVP